MKEISQFKIVLFGIPIFYFKKTVDENYYNAVILEKIK